MSVKKWKRGDFNPETNLYFYRYEDSLYEKEVWNTKEKFEEKVKKHNERVKINNKIYYSNNKEKESKRKAKGRKNLKLNNPLKIRLNTTLINTNARNKRGRNLEHTLTLKQLKEKLIHQEGKCFYSGILMIQELDSNNPRELSIERLDSSIDYTNENVVLCCKMLNLAKNQFSTEEMRLFFKDLQESHKFKEFLYK